MLHNVTNLMVFSAAIAATVFVVRYSRVAWNRSGLGWSTMALWLVFALILGLASSTVIWGEWLGRDWARFVVYLLINVVMWSQVWQLFAGQRAARREKTELDTSATMEPPDEEAP